MDRKQLRELNKQIASMHNDNDVYSYERDFSRMINFPRGFIKTLDQNRAFISFIKDEELKTHIANHLMLRDTLHWLWLKTDIVAHARSMLIKNQLINLGSILEGIIFSLSETAPKKYQKNVYKRIEYLHNQGLISEVVCVTSKKLWEARRQIHLHLIKGIGHVEFTDDNYISWHESIRDLISELQEKIRLR